MEIAETYALPLEGELGTTVRRTNEFQEPFAVRPGLLRFQTFHRRDLNIKVILKVHRDDGTSEQFIVDTDPSDGFQPEGSRHTRSFVIQPFAQKQGRATCLKFSYIVHIDERSVPSRHEYILMDGPELDENHHQRRQITREWATPNGYRTAELDAGLLQRDVDWYNRHPESLRIVPKFTKGQPFHPYHPKRFIHEQIDAVIRRQREAADGQQRAIKVCVDCIDDTDFVTHLIHAADDGVRVQCLVDWRKMTLTSSDNYIRLKRSGIELLGVFCTPRHPLIEVAPDMHNKFIIFGDEDCVVGSFNVTFDRWWANWESGLAFHSSGVCRLLDNVFQSVRGGVIQRYGVDPLSPFNLLYTFGRHAMLNGRYYRPHHAIISEIHRARSSIRAALFFVGELLGEYGDSVVDALIQARARGVDVRLILNGHMARQGSPAQEYSMCDELQRPLLPALERLQRAGISMALAYGLVDHQVPFSPLHSKYCVVDNRVVMDGSFNWYNTSTFSHDLLVVLQSEDVARHYLYEFNQILRLFRIHWIPEP